MKITAFCYNVNSFEVKDMLYAVIGVLILIEVFLIIFLNIRFIRFFFKYKYMGNSLYYIIPCYLLCLFFSIFVALRPAEGLVESTKFASGILNSFVDGLKMMVGGFDGNAIASYLDLNEPWSIIFAIAYLVASFFSLVATSTSVVVFTIRMIGVKVKNYFESKNAKRVSYIFTEHSVPFSMRLAQKLKEDGDIVRIIVSRGSLKTQDGTEFKDAIELMGFDVWTENKSSNFASLLLKRDWKYNSNKTVSIYGLYYEDEDSLDFTNDLKLAIHKDKRFSEIKNKIDQYQKDNSGEPDISDEDLSYLKRLRVFVKYEEFDPETIYRYTQETFGIINTISEYDMVSSDFVENNPISNFLDLKSLSESNKEIKGLNITFCGFGNVNKAIFKKINVAYQLWGDNINVINYHILDREGKDGIIAFDDLYSNNNGKDVKGFLPIPNLFNMDVNYDDIDLTSEKSIIKHIKDIKDDPSRFVKDGFEIFIVSVMSSNVSARTSYYLRKAILSQIPEDKLSRTAIFVRISERQAMEDFDRANNCCFLQERFLDGFNSKEYLEAGSPLCPIIAFGEDSIMSNYINHTFEAENRLAAKMNHFYMGIDSISDKKAEVDWLNKDKENILTNKAALWQLKAKLSMFGLKINDDLTLINQDGNQVSKENFEKMVREIIPEEEKDVGEKGRHILQMEHNRWLAATNLIFNYRPLELETYLHNPNKTKNSDSAKHVCMTTNEGLQTLRKTVLADPRWAKDEKVIKRMNNLLYYSDMNGLVFLFSIISK